MPTVNRPDGTTIYYELHGSGPTPVLLIQGLAASIRFWHQIPQQLASNGKWTLVAMDNRGAGRSTASGGIWSLNTFADDCAAVLDDLSASKALVVGNSMGGMVAQRFAVRHAARTRGLMLMSTLAGLPHTRIPTARALLNIGRVATGPKHQITEALAELLLTRDTVAQRHELLRAFPELLSNETPRDMWTFLRQLLAITTHVTQPGDIRCPTVVIAGKEDLLISPDNSKTLAAKIPGAQLILLPGIGHSIPVMAPHAVGETLAKLTASVG